MVGRGERRSDLVDQSEPAIERPRPQLQRIRQRAAPEEAHRHIGAIRIPPVVENRDDVWMLELRDQLGLALETAQELRVMCIVGADHLDGDVAGNGRLAGAIDNTESSLPDALAKLELADRSSPAFGVG